jgi:hypothetical protein
MHEYDELSGGIMNRGDEINRSRLTLSYSCNYHNSSKRNTVHLELPAKSCEKQQKQRTESSKCLRCDENIRSTSLEHMKYYIAYQGSINLVTGKYKKCTEYYSAIDDRIVSMYIYIYQITIKQLWLKLSTSYGNKINLWILFSYLSIPLIIRSLTDNLLDVLANIVST